MSHLMIEELQSRKGEKVALFLTMENATGLILGAVPIFLLTFRTLPWYLTLLITISAASVGFVATLSVGGMAFYERVVWWVRGALKQRLSSARLTPEEISGGRAVGQPDAALALGGAVRLVRRKQQLPLPHPRATPLRQRAVHVVREPVGAGTNGSQTTFD
jgi:hypothetical protein